MREADQIKALEALLKNEVLIKVRLLIEGEEAIVYMNASCRGSASLVEAQADGDPYWVEETGLITIPIKIMIAPKEKL